MSRSAPAAPPRATSRRHPPIGGCAVHLTAGRSRPTIRCAEPLTRGSLDAMTRTSPDTGAAAISVQHLRKTYGDIVAVDDVSFEVQPGEIFGILGPNGAGKTTTVESLMGLRRPDSGRISVLGLDPR